MSDVLTILFELLKINGINRIFLSAGIENKNEPEDPFFTVKKILDRRSLSYYAMGVAQHSNKPVAIIIDNDDASVADLLPGITEAYYQDVPLLIVQVVSNLSSSWLKSSDFVIGDKSKSVISLLHHDYSCENQMINKMCYAIDSLTKYRGGPVFLQLENQKTDDICFLKALKRHSIEDIIDAPILTRETFSGKNVFLIPDPCSSYSTDDVDNIICFCKCNNIRILPNDVYSFDMKTQWKRQASRPNLVIQFGTRLYDSTISELMKMDNIDEYWIIEPDPDISDSRFIVSDIWDCDWRTFINYMPSEEISPSLLLHENDKMNQSVSIVHRIVSNIATRVQSEIFIYGFRIFNEDITNALAGNSFIRSVCYSDPTGNDGKVSVFIGQSVILNPTVSILFIDSDQFFLDMNALHIRHIDKNVRICLFTTSDDECEKALAWAHDCGFTTLKYNKDNESLLDRFLSDSVECPLLLTICLEHLR